MATAPRMTAAEREREVREEATRKSRLGVRMGTVGVVLLFLGGVGILLLPEGILGFLVVMAVGIVLVFAAFLLVRGSVAEVSVLRTKIS